MKRMLFLSGAIVFLSAALARAADPPSPVEAKLDLILNKLDDMERRLKKLEESPSASYELSSRIAAKVSDFVGGMASLFGISINAPGAHPNPRGPELLNTKEDLIQIEYEWDRLWLAQPSHLTPERTHGGIQ